MMPLQTKAKEEAASLPGFLKLAFIVPTGGVLAYMLFAIGAQTPGLERGPLVRGLQTAAEASAGMMFGVTALVVFLGVAAVALSFGRPRK